VSALLGPYPDAELVMLDLLAPVAATVTHTDDDLTAPTVQVARVGGADDGITDRPRVQVTCYGATRPQAWQLAEQARQIVLAAAGTAVSGDNVTDVFIDSTRTATPAQQLPDRNRDLRVVTATYLLAMRRPRTS
jgi:hypothetical protein